MSQKKEARILKIKKAFGRFIFFVPLCGSIGFYALDTFGIERGTYLLFLIGFPMSLAYQFLLEDILYPSERQQEQKK